MARNVFLQNNGAIAMKTTTYCFMMHFLTKHIMKHRAKTVHEQQCSGRAVGNSITNSISPSTNSRWIIRNIKGPNRSRFANFANNNNRKCRTNVTLPSWALLRYHIRRRRSGKQLQRCIEYQMWRYARELHF